MGVPGNQQDDGEVPPLAPGAQLGKYTIVRLLGAGGMGAVYEATHNEIGKRVAVKVLSPAIAAVPGARARFLREAQLTSRVRHPHIVDVTDMGTDGGQTFLVMEFLSGEDLAQRRERLGSIPTEEMVDIMLPICAAVAAAHQAGITHRDLKPNNLFLATDGRRLHPKVLDFGISKGTSPGDGIDAGTLTATGAVIGTAYYLAPEQIIDSRAAGPASDQYALGVILYECLTGQRPFGGETLFVVFQNIVSTNARPPRELKPTIPLGLEDVILRAMLHEPRERFRSVEEFGHALLPFASARGRLIWDEVFGNVQPVAGPVRAAGSATVAAVPFVPTRQVVTDQTVVPEGPPSRRGLWIAIAGALVALAALGGLLASRGSHAPEPAAPAADTSTPPAPPAATSAVAAAPPPPPAPAAVAPPAPTLAPAPAAAPPVPSAAVAPAAAARAPEKADVTVPPPAHPAHRAHAKTKPAHPSLSDVPVVD